MSQPGSLVESMEIFSVRIPFGRSFAHSLAEHRESRPVVVRLALANGIVGYGEAQPRPYLTGETESSVLEVLSGPLGQRLLGKSVSGLSRAVDLLSSPEFREARGVAPAAFCALELALLDAAGRQENRPVTDVLGPVRRTEMPYDGAVIGFLPSSVLRLYLAQIRKRRLRVVKVKVGLPNDVERVAIIRSALPDDIELVLDANGAWSADEAIERIHALERFGLAAVEQPVPREDVEGMARVCRTVYAPIMADESVCTVADARRLLDRDACDMWNLRVGKCGGLLGTLELVQLANENGIGCQLGVLVGETGILGAASRLLAACVTRFRYLEFDGSGIMREDLLQRPLPPVVDKRAALPVGSSGLGIEVDTVRLRTLATDCLSLRRSGSEAGRSAFELSPTLVEREVPAPVALERSSPSFAVVRGAEANERAAADAAGMLALGGYRPAVLEGKAP